MLKNKAVVGISGASGTIIGVRLLEALKKCGLETHLVMSEVSKKILVHETSYSPADVEKLADFSYNEKDFFAPIASGSFKSIGMAIAPCSMKTLSAIANGYSDNLLSRAADVCLKEKRRLVLVARETPLSYVHLENMKKVSLAGAVILPPVMTFYSKPKSIDEMVNHITGKILDSMGIENDIYKRWC